MTKAAEASAGAERNAFVLRYGGIYECSPWVAEQTFDQAAGVADPERLAEIFTACVDRADDDVKLALIRAHPDLAGRAAIRGELTAESTGEQASAGIDRCTPEEFERFQSLNRRYKEKFGFPFVMAVRGSTRHEILAAFEERLGSTRDAEFERAIAEIHKIARMRLRVGARHAGDPPPDCSHTPTHPFHHWVRLEQPRLGTRVVLASDEFFGAKERLIDDAEPVFVPDKYDDHGKWMDGWESRRKRTPGHDWCIVRLGIPGVIRGLDIDTRHFTGNFPPYASVDAAVSDAEIPEDDEWGILQEKVALQGNSRHLLPVQHDRPVTHVRLNIFPDGGVARLRIFGEVRPDWSPFDRDSILDLLALEHGGRALCCSDEHFGSMHHLNLAGRGVNMGDGWETARRRGPGNDWVVLRLGHPGIVERVEIDTAHFKGNYPDRAVIQAALLTADDADNTDRIVKESENWPLLLPECKLSLDAQHYFTEEVQSVGPVSHIRLSIFPDGGVSRLRLFGRLADLPR